MGITITLTDEQVEEVLLEAEEAAKKPPEGAIPPEVKTELMIINFDEIWLQPYSENEVQYPNANFKVTSSAGVAVAVKMPGKVQGGKDFRITDVLIPETQHSRSVCWSLTPDFDNPISSGTGGNSAWAALPLKSDMAGKTYYFCSKLTSGTIPSSYEAMFQGLNR